MMNNQSYIEYVEFHNFIGFYNVMRMTELKLDLRKFKGVDLILIVGQNGVGKTTMLNNITPLIDPTVGGTCIRPNHTGMKIVHVRNDKGELLECKIVYKPTKTGHSSSANISKNGVELNPERTVKSYLAILEQELGLTPNIGKLLIQGNSKDLTDMTARERKEVLIDRLPIDDLSFKYSVINKEYRDMKARVGILSNSISSSKSAAELESAMEETTRNINFLVSRRDDAISNKSSARAHMTSIGNVNTLESMHDKTVTKVERLKNEVSILTERIKVSQYQLESAIGNIPDDLDQCLKEIDASSNELQTTKSNTIYALDTIKRRRNTLYDSKQKKQKIVDDYDSTNVEEITSTIRALKSKIEDGERLINGRDIPYSEDDLISGRELVRAFRDLSDNIWGTNDREASEYAFEHWDNDTINDNIDTLNRKLGSLHGNVISIDNSLTFVNNKIKGLGSGQLTVKPHPKCEYMDCPLRGDSGEHERLMEEYHRLEDERGKAVKKVKEAEAHMKFLTRAKSAQAKILSGVELLKANNRLVERLPLTSNYETVDKLINSLRNISLLDRATAYDPYADLLYLQRDIELKRREIAELESKMNNQQDASMVKYIREELVEIDEELSSVEEEIATKEIELDEVNSKIEAMKIVRNKVQTLKDDEANLHKAEVELGELGDTLLVVQGQLSDYYEHKKDYDDAVTEFAEVESRLKPLTSQRDALRTEQVRLIQNTNELKSLQSEMLLVADIVDSLSTKGGIPVDDAKLYTDTIINNANNILVDVLGGTLSLGKIAMSDSECNIPYRRNGGEVKDIKTASSAERSFSSLAIMLAMIQMTVDRYPIIQLDEPDSGFDEDSKSTFARIIKKNLAWSGITQAFMNTHNREFYDGFDVGYILFPGNTVPDTELEGKPYINIKECGS